MLNKQYNNLLAAMMYHFAWNLFIHVFAINPVDNMGNPLPYTILVVLEILICFLLFFTVERGKENVNYLSED